MKKWEAIATGGLTKKLMKKLEEIAGVLREIKDPQENPGLMSGKTGIAIFLSYYGRFSGDDAYTEKAFALFSEIFAEVNDGFQHPDLNSGLAGIGWAIEHVVRFGFFQADTGEILSEVDNYLAQVMITDMQKGKYDYLYNALGLALYFLGRESPAGFSVCMTRLVNELDAHAEAKGQGSRWASIDPKMGCQVYDLSLSRGLASIISLLVKLHKRGVAPDQVDRLLVSAVTYLLEQTLDPQQYSTHFPSLIRDDRPIYHSRLDWCFGDTGIAVSLWNAAAATGNREWKKKAMEVLLDSACKRDAKLVAGIVSEDSRQEGIVDTGICHGAAGLAHIYNRIYQETGLENLQDASLYWLEKTLELAIFADGYAGYKAWGPKEFGGWKPKSGILYGIAGIGLVFLAAVSATCPQWDEALLLS
jgi:lantibiotic biosynthesis protein